MSEMIERVALAICGDSNPENILKIHRIRARAAIEAMREPTEAMVCINAPDMPAGGSVADIWEDMIDAALSTPNTDKT